MISKLNASLLEVGTKLMSYKDAQSSLILQSIKDVEAIVSNRCPGCDLTVEKDIKKKTTCLLVKK